MGNCPKCGSQEIYEVTVDQDVMGNYVRALVCSDCDYVIDQQDSAFQCLHCNYERDEVGHKWCLECGEYLGER